MWFFFLRFVQQFCHQSAEITDKEGWYTMLARLVRIYLIANLHRNYIFPSHKEQSS